MIRAEELEEMYQRQSSELKALRGARWHLEASIKAKVDQINVTRLMQAREAGHRPSVGEKS